MAKGASKAGDVFKETYEVAVRHMHPEDAAGVAQDAVLNYLEMIGATRPVVSVTEHEGMAVRVSNVEELKEVFIEGTLAALGSEQGAEIVDKHLAEGVKYFRNLSGDVS